MNTKQIVLSVVLLDFLALTAYAVHVHGYIGLFAHELSSWAGIQVLTDLTLALGMVMAWMVVDARKHGLKVAPYLLGTLALGSVAPLVYLIRREWALRER